MKKLLILSFILFSVAMFSQTTLLFKDSISKKPSPFIMVFNEQQEIIGTSDELGEFSIENRRKLTNKIFLKSIFYEEKEIAINKLEANKTILLTPLVNLLDEVNIDSKKYAVLTAYYRIYHLVDDELISFIDAEVKYIIKKNTIQKKVLNYRIFDSIASNENTLSKKPFWVPDLKKTSLFEKLNSKFNLIKNKEDNFINIIGKEDRLLYGTIKADINVKNKSNTIIEVLKDSKYFDNVAIQEYYNDELLKTTIKDLKHTRWEVRRNITDEIIKIVPILKGRKEVIDRWEIFIQNVEYISKDEYKTIKKMGYKDYSKSHYTKEFWKGLETFTPLNPLVEKQLNEILVERK